MVPLNICFWNAKANSQNKYELSQFLDQHEHDAVILSETHLKNNKYFHLNGYTFYETNHPDGKARGGTGIPIKKHIWNYELPSIATACTQAASIHIDTQIGFLNLAAV